MHEVVSKLGVEYTCGRARPRTGGPRRMRYKKQTARRRRLGKLSRLGCRVAQVVKRGLNPSCTYGGIVHGVSDHELGVLSSLTSCATSPNTRGTSRTLKLLVTGDPAVTANTGIILQWAGAVWRACGPRQSRRRTDPSPALIDAALKRANMAMTASGNLWDKVAGPAGAAILTAKRMGWRYISGFRIETERGEALDMATTDPRGICAAAERATRKAAKIRAARKEGLPDADLGAWTGPIKRAPNSRAMTPMARSALRRAYTGGYWPNARRAAQGLTDDPTCPHCGRGPDDLYHRIWECEVCQELREQYTSEDMRTAAARAARDDPLWTRALRTEPFLGMPPPRRDHDEQWFFADGIPHECYFKADVFTDGSATNPQ